MDRQQINFTSLIHNYEKEAVWGSEVGVLLEKGRGFFDLCNKIGRRYVHRWQSTASLQQSQSIRQ